MAAKDQLNEKSKKRKHNLGSKSEKDVSQKKKKLVEKDVSQKKKKLAPKTPPEEKKPHKLKFEKSEHDEQNNFSESKREGRIRAKELAEARKKKRKRHYNLEQELATLWEKMRHRNIGKEDRSKLITEALQKMKGKIPEIAGSHVSSRVLQTCVKYCSQAERDVVFGELQPHLLSLTCNTYAVHLVKKMLDSASKKQLAGFISTLRGHVAALLRHMVGSVVVEHAYHLGSAAQKQELLMELYSTELQLFKDLTSMKETRLVDIISKLGLQKGAVVRHMTSVIQPILEKGIVDHSIIHKLLIEYLSVAEKSSATDALEPLSGPLLVRMIHTREGSRLGMLCVKHGSAKERKKIIKGMKGHIGKIAHDQCGNMVLVCIVSTVDDTKLIRKIVIRELETILKDLILDKNGRRLLLQLLHPNCSRYLSPEDLASLDLSVPSLCAKGESEPKIKVVENGEEDGENKDEVEMTETEADQSSSPNEKPHPVEGGKKDPILRRQELLVNSGLAENLIDLCIENTEEFLKSNFAKEVIYEVARGGADGILHPALDDKLNKLHEAISSLVGVSKSGEAEAEHVLENFHSSRTIRKLILDCPAFASTLWKKALEGNCKLWAQGHSSKVIRAFMESSNAGVCKMAEKELQGLIDNGLLETKQDAVKEA